MQHIHATVVIALVLNLGSFAASDNSSELVRSGDSIFLRASAGTRITVQDDVVHAYWSHRGVWQALIIEKDGGGIIHSGDSIFLKGHTGNAICIHNHSVQLAPYQNTTDEKLIVEKRGAGEGAILFGDNLVLKAHNGDRIAVIDGSVLVQPDQTADVQSLAMEKYVPGVLDGRWTRKSDLGREVFVIKGDTMNLVDGVQTGIAQQSDNFFITSLSGDSSHTSARLNGEELDWTNGDVWIRAGSFDGRWVDTAAKGKRRVYTIWGDDVHLPDNGTLKLVPHGQTAFSMFGLRAELVDNEIRWSNGSVWEPLPASDFDGCWTDREDPGRDLFYIHGHMVFFDDGLEAELTFLPNHTFSAGPFGSKFPDHHIAQLVAGAIVWTNGDVWVRVQATSTSTLTSTRTSTVTATTTATITSKPFCLEEDVAYEPDMPLAAVTIEDGPLTCQKRCADTPACEHFSYNIAGDCHLQDLSSLRQTDRAGFIAGPARCFEDTEKLSIARGQGMGNGTFVAARLRCIEIGVGYSPSMDGNLTTIQESDPESAVRACQNLCRARDGCAHFTIEFPAKVCHFASETSAIFHQMQGYISGPPACSNRSGEGLEGQAIQEFVERLPRGFFEAGLGHRAGVATMIFVLCVFLLHLHRTGRCVQLCRTSPTYPGGYFGAALPSSRLPMISPVLPAFVGEYLSDPSSRSLSMAVLGPRTSRFEYMAVGSDPPASQADEELVAGEHAGQEYDPL